MKRICLKCGKTFEEKPSRIKQGRGKFCSQKCKGMGFDTSGKNHPNWQGNKVGYCALHSWVKRHYGKANKCEWCLGKRKSKRFEWANLSGDYKRKRSDWIMLCSKCHHQRDDIVNKGWATKKGLIYVS